MQKTKTVVFSIVSISFWGMLAKLLGLLREGVFANYFGTSAEMDVFGLIGGYVTTMMSILASSLAGSYSPLYVRNLQQKGERVTAEKFSHLLNQYALFSTVGYILFFFAAPLLTAYLEKNIQGVPGATILLYTRLLFFCVITGGMTRLVVSALTGLRKYGWMQITQVIYSVITIILTILFVNTLGINIIVYAFVVNSVLQFFILFIVLFQGERRYRPVVDFADEETKVAWKGVVPIFLGTEIFMIGLTIDRTIGTTLGIVGAVAALNYAGTLYGMLVNIISAPIKTVFGTEMYRHYYKTENRDVLYEDLSKIIVHVGFIMIPIAVGLFVFSNDFVSVVLRRGAFDEHSAAMTSAAFCMYALATPILSFRGSFSGVHIALNDRKTPMWSGVIFIIINIAISWILSRCLGLIGITIGAFVALMVSFVYQVVSLRRRYGYDKKFFNPDFTKIIFAAILTSVVLVFALRLVALDNLYLRFAVEIGLYAVIYLFSLHLMKCGEFERVWCNTVGKIISSLKNRKNKL